MDDGVNQPTYLLWDSTVPHIYTLSVTHISLNTVCGWVRKSNMIIKKRTNKHSNLWFFFTSSHTNIHNNQKIDHFHEICDGGMEKQIVKHLHIWICVKYRWNGVKETCVPREFAWFVVLYIIIWVMVYFLAFWHYLLQLNQVDRIVQNKRKI